MNNTIKKDYRSFATDKCGVSATALDKFEKHNNIFKKNFII